MKLKVKYYLYFVAILLFFVIRSLYFNLSSEINDNEKTYNFHASQSIAEPEKRDITLILRYNSDRSNYLLETANSFLALYPFMPLIIVSDSVIPKVIMNNISNFSGIINIPLQLDLLNLLVDRNVANHIKTRYVFIVPIGVQAIMPNEISNLMKLLKENKDSFLAVPVENRSLKCLKLELNLIQWSVTYRIHENGEDCNCLKGDHGILMDSKTLSKIAEPFLLPFPDAFYIQAASLNINVKPIYSTSLKIKNEVVPSPEHMLKNQFQKQLMNKKFKIKKVIRENGVIEWYGCTRNTQRCFPNVMNSIPDYLNQGRWTPPCCLKVLRETVHHVFKILKEWNVTFWLEGGSLLGAVRMKDIIPWDYDVDIGIYLKDIDKCPWLRMVHLGKFEKKQHQFVVDNEGFVWEKARPEEGDFYRVQASVHNRLHVDIFPFFSKNGIMTKKTWFATHPQDIEFPEHYLKPLTTIEFTGIQAPAPNNVKEFLELKFGKDCVENPQYPDPKLFPFPAHIKSLLANNTLETYDTNINSF